MEKNRYPRLGQPLAPRALREILGLPLPDWAVHGLPDGAQLADLDASAWERFDETTCRRLAGEILHEVGRAARATLTIANRRLPPIPGGLHLFDLNLESRTLHCLVAAGLHQRPQDLESMTIEQVLGLRGFWAKCLVDLLTALEYAADHPEAAHAHCSALLFRNGRSAHRYPRPGQRIAPQTLRSILNAPIPGEWTVGSRWGGRRLADLDERVWNDLPADRIAWLGERIVQRVNLSATHRELLQQRIPRPPRGSRLEDLQLENRTYNCLAREGYAQSLDPLGRKTVGQLLGIRAFGAKCLVDLLCALESLAAREVQVDARLIDVAERLSARLDAAEIHVTDPRLGPLLRTIDSQADTVGALVQQVLRRKLDPCDPVRLYDGLSAILDQVERLRQLPLETELAQIFSASTSLRDREIVAAYYGWNGSGRNTLEMLGRRYGLSRERIRQVCVRAVKGVRGTRVFAPVLDRVLEFVAHRLPAPLERLQATFDAAGFSACRLPLSAIADASAFVGRPRSFVVVSVEDQCLVVAPGVADLPRRILQAARRAVQNYGVATTRAILQEVGGGRLPPRIDTDLVAETLQTMAPFQWLDARRQWFRLDWLPQYGLPNMIEKVLAVTRRIDGTRLRAALGRYRRTGRPVPPVSVLLEFCRQMPGVCVEGQVVWAEPPLDWREILSGVERGMVEVLLRHGPVLDRSVFEEHCVRLGLNRFSFNAIVMASPVIAQYGRSLYGLIGVKVDRKTVESLSCRRAHQEPAHVLADYGTAEDGRLFIAYRLSKAAITGGVITVPAAFKDRAAGRFALFLPDGRSAGVLVSKKGCAWGLGPALRSQDARPGEPLLILIDPEKREAELRIGEPSGAERILCHPEEVLV